MKAYICYIVFVWLVFKGIDTLALSFVSCRAIVLVWISFVHSLLCLQLKPVSYSHQTICTYITDKPTPFESVNVLHHVITAILWSYDVYTCYYTCYITCYCLLCYSVYLYQFITLQVPFWLESLWVEMIYTRTDFGIRENCYGLKW